MSRRRTIVLYNPSSVFYTMPLGLLAVASALDRSRFDVRIVDHRLGGDPLQDIEDALCLGVSVLTGAPIRDALRVSREAKRRRPDLPVIWGGWHPSLFPEATLSESSVDVTVQAQGERTFAELVEVLAEGGSPGSVRGLTYRAPDGCMRRTAPRVLDDMNALPPHDYGLLPVERYFAYKGRRQLDYISSTGCFYRCAFCADPFVYGRRWTALAPERIGAELEALCRTYDVDEVAFQDETFFTYTKRVEAIAEDFLRRKLGIRWTATMRADQGRRLNDETFEKLVASGLRRVLVGVESGSQDMMDWMSKDVTIADVMETAEKCVRHGIGGIFPFIVGFPDESDESVQASMDLAGKLCGMSPRFETPIFYFKPYPGSRITGQVVASGYSLPETLEEWADFDFVGSSGPWVSQEKYRVVERFKFYNRAASVCSSWALRPLQRLARWRCRHRFFFLPVEKIAAEWLRPQPRLS